MGEKILCTAQQDASQQLDVHHHSSCSDLRRYWSGHSREERDVLTSWSGAAPGHAATGGRLGVHTGQCLCCWHLSGCSHRLLLPCNSRIRSLKMLVLPSERGFQPLAPPEFSTLAKVIAATCPTRAWEVLTTMMVGALQHPLNSHPCPSLDGGRLNQVLKVTLFQQ